MRRHQADVSGILQQFYTVICVVVLFAACAVSAVAQVRAAGRSSSAGSNAAAAKAAVVSKMQLFPLAFEQNQAKGAEGANFVAHGAGYAVKLERGGTVLNVGAGNSVEQVRLKIVGANPAADAIGSDLLPTKINYLIGNDRSKWRTGISTYGKVSYRQVYPGIDLVFYGNQGQLEHDFVLAPNANVKNIELAISGARNVSIDREGNLVLATLHGEIRLLKPAVYQQIGEHRQPVVGRFVLKGRNRVGFAIATYDHRRELVIDPVLNWNTYLYGTFSDTTKVKAIAIDGSGNAFVAGNTTSASATGFNGFNTGTPTTFSLHGPGAAGDVFIARIDDAASGTTVSGSTLKWLTFIGGSGAETASATTLDGTNVFVVGQTSSTSTGGGNGDLPVTGTTAFETTGTVKNANTSGFVEAVDQNSGATLAYGSYVGENQGGKNSAATGIVVKGGTDISSGANLYITGWTTGNTKLLVTPEGYKTTFSGAQDGFLVQVDPRVAGVNGSANSYPAGALVYGGYIRVSSAGGGDSITVNAIAVDKATPPDWQANTTYNLGDAILPTSNNAGGYVYIAAPAGNSPTSSNTRPNFTQTVGGTTNDNTGQSKIVWTNVGKATGNVYLAGSATGHLMPTGSGCPTPTSVSGTAGFVTKMDMSMGGCNALNTTASYSTEIGGGTSTTTSVNAMAIDNVTGATTAKAFITGSTTSTSATLHTNVPTNLASGLQDTSCSGCGDAFVGELSTTGAVTWSGYLGGDKADAGNAIAVDASGASGATVNVAVVGSTQSAQTGQGATNAFPLVNPPNGVSALSGTQSAFLTLITGANATPSVDFSTYFGGSGTDNGNAVALVGAPSPAGVVAYFGGDTTSLSLQTNAVAFEQGSSLASQTLGTCTSAAGTLTCATTSAHNFMPSMIVTISGAGSNNGTYTLLTASGTSFTAATGQTAVTNGGTVTPIALPNAEGFVGKAAFINTAATMTMTGPGSVGLNSCSASGTVISCTTSAAHNFAVGTQIAISGATPSIYNGAYTIAGVGSTTFTANSSIPAATAASSGGTVNLDNIGFNAAKSYKTQNINYTFFLTPGTTSDYVTFNATVPMNGANAILKIDSATPTQGTCRLNSAGSGVTCQLGTLTSAQSVAMVLEAASGAECDSASSCTSIPYSFTASAEGAEIGDHASATISGNAVPVTDLQISADSGSVGSVAVGGSSSITYNVTVINNGPNDVSQAQVIDTLPNPANVTNGFVIDAVTFNPVGNPGTWSCDNASPAVPGQLKCVTGATFASGASVTIQIAGHFDSTVDFGSPSASLTNTATVSASASPAPFIDNVANDTLAAASTTVTRTADLATTAYSDNTQTPPANLGTTDGVQLTATVQNNGPDPALNVKVRFAILGPTNGGAGFSFTVDPGTNCSGVTAGTSFSGGSSYNIDCTLTNTTAGSTLGNGSSTTVGLKISPDSSWIATGSNSGTITSTAMVSSTSVTDPTPADGTETSSQITSKVARFADLSATLADATNDSTSAHPAALTDATNPVTLVATISNAAISGNDSDATNVKIDFTINDGHGPAAATADASRSITSSDGSCAVDTVVPDYHIIHCTVTKSSGTVTAGTTNFTFTLKYVPGALSPILAAASKETSITTTAKVFSADVYDDGAGGIAGTNNTSAAATSWLARIANLALVLSDNTQSTPVPLSDNTKPIIFTAAVTNNGPDPASNAQVVFTLQQNQGGSALTTGYTVLANTFPAGSTCTPVGLVITCTINTTLANAANPSYTISIAPDNNDATSNWLSKTATGGTGYITSNAEVSSPDVWDDGLNVATPDGSPGLNNVSPLASASPNVLHSNLRRTSDLQVTAFADLKNYNASNLPTSSSNRSPLAGTLTYTVTLQNNGPDTSEGTKVLIPIPTVTGQHLAPTLQANPGAQAIFPGTSVTTTADGCNVDAVNSQLVCLIDELKVSAGSVSYSVSILPDQTWAVAPTLDFATSGTASADFAFDPTAGNNAQNTTSYFERLADVQLTSDTSANSSATTAANLTGTTSSGTPLTFNATVTNGGPDSATGINTVFTLPGPGYTNISTPVSNSGVTCAIGSNTSTVDCTVPTIASSSATSFQFSVTPDPTWLPANAGVTSFTVATTASSSQVVDDGTNGAPGANNSSTPGPTAFIERKADLQVTAFTENSFAQTGHFIGIDDSLVLTATVNNAGPDTVNLGATNFATSNNVPITFTFSSSTAGTPTYNFTNVAIVTGAGLTALDHCDAPIPSNPVSGSVTCYITTPMTSGASNKYSISLSPDPNWASGGTPAYEGSLKDDGLVSSANVVDDGASGAAGNNNNTATSSLTATSQVARKADLAISTSVTDGSTTATAPASLTGGNKTINLSATVTNNGPDDVGANPFNIVFTLTPAQAGASFAGMSATAGTNLTGCVTAPNTPGAGQVQITCATTAQPTKPTGTNPSYVYTVGVVADPSWVPASGSKGINSFTSAAAISQNVVLDAVPGNNATTSNTTSYVARTSNLVLNTFTNTTAVASPSPLTSTVTYSVAATNNGPDTTTSDVQVQFTLPTSGYALAGGGTGTPVGFTSCLKNLAVITCTYPSTLANAASTGSLQVSIIPDDAWVGTGTSGLASKTIQAEVSSPSVWDNGIGNTPSAPGSPLSNPLGDNDLQSTTYVQRKSDLAITSFSDQTTVASPAPLSASGALAFTTAITNNGPDPAQTVTVSLALPTTGYTVFNPPAGCSQAGGSNTIICTIAGEWTGNKTLSLSVTPDATVVSNTALQPASAQITTATIGSVDVVDANNANNSNTWTSQLERQSALNFPANMTDNSAIAITGPNQWTITTPAENSGPDASPNTVVVYTFPNTWSYGTNGFTLSGGSTNYPGGCVSGPTDGFAANQVVCSIGTLTKSVTPTNYTLTLTPDTTAIGTSQSTTYQTNSLITTFNAGTSGCCTLNTSSATANTTSRITTPIPLTTTIERTSTLQIVAETDDPTTNGNPTSVSNPVSLSGTLQLVSSIQNASGPDTAAGVTVTYTFPTAGFALVTNTFGAGGTFDPTACVKSSNQVVCSYSAAGGGLLPVSGSPTVVTLSVTPDPAWVPANASNATITVNAAISGAVLNKAVTNVNRNQPSTIGRIANLQITAQTDATGTGSLQPGQPSSVSNPQPTGGATTLTLNSTLQNLSGDPVTGFVAVYTFTSTGSGFALSSNTWGVNGTNDPTACVLNSVAKTVTCTYAGLLSTGNGPTHFLLSVVPDSTWVGPTQTTNTEPISVAFASTYASSPYNTAGLNLSNNVTSTIGRVSNLQITKESDVTPAGAVTPGAQSSASNPVPLAGPLTVTTAIQNTGPDAATGFTVEYSFGTAGYAIVGKSGYDTCTLNGSDATKVDCTVTSTQLAVSNTSSTTYSLSVTPDPAWVTTSQQSATRSVSANLQYSLNSTVSNTTVAFNSTIGRVANLQFTTTAGSQNDVGSASFTANTQSSISNPISLAGPLQLNTRVQNLNGDTVANLTVTYTFPTTNFAFVSTTYPGGCVVGTLATQLVCTVTSLAAPTATTFALTITPDPTWVGTSQQTAAVNTTMALGYPFNLASSNTTTGLTSTIGRIGNVQVTYEADGPPPAGPVSSNANPVPLSGPLNLYTTITDSGPDAVVPTTVTYAFPTSGYSLVSNTYPGNCVVGSTTTQVVCSINTLINGANTFNLKVTPDPNWIASNQTLATQSISATVAYSFNKAPGNTSAAFVSTFGRVSDVQITPQSGLGNLLTDVAANNLPTSATNPSSLAGPLKFNVPLVNSGPNAVANVPITYTFPTNISNAQLITNTYSGGCVINANQVTCTISNLPISSTPVVNSISITPDPSWATCSGAIPNCTTLSAATAQISVPVALGYTLNSAAANQSGTIHSVVGRVSDLKIVTLTDNSAGSPPVVSLAGPLIYSVNVTNLGPDDAVGDNVNPIVTTFTLPTSGYKFVSTTFPGNCTQTGGSATVVCSLGNLLTKSSSPTYTLTITPDTALQSQSSQTFSATTSATISSLDVFDNGPSGNVGPNNSANITTTLQRMSHLSIDPITSNYTSTTFAQLGQTVSYLFKVRNAATTAGGLNTAAAAGVTANVTLPVGFINASTTSPGWTCNFANIPSCTFSGTILPDGAGGNADNSSALTITGTYTDDPTVMHLTGGGTYNGGANTYTVGQGNGGQVAATPGTTLSANPDSLNPVSTSTNVQRNTLITVAQQVSSPNPPTAANLGSTVTYTFQVGNAAVCGSVACNTADTVTLNAVFPVGFLFTTYNSQSGSWSCNYTSGTLTLSCTVASVAASRLSDQLVVTGTFDTGLNLASGGVQTETITGSIGSTASVNSATGTSTALNITTNIQRSVDLSVSMTAPTVVGGAAVLGQTGGDPGANTATYSITVTNNGANDAGGGTTTVPNAMTMTWFADASAANPSQPGPLAAHFNTTSATSSGNTGVNCNTSTPGQVVCTYPKQAAGTSTNFTITGQFDGSVALAGSSAANSRASISSIDSFDTSNSNNAAASAVTVVDTPASGTTLSGTAPVTLSATGKPTTVVYSNVTVPGITTQTVTTTAPTGFLQPAPTATASYAATSPQYEVVGVDSTYPVTFSGAVNVCVAINAASFANPTRVRLFDSRGTDITNSLSATQVCGQTVTMPNAFTVREPVTHAPTAVLAQPSQVLTSGGHGGAANQFQISATGSTDPDFSQFCNGSVAGSNAAQFCGDTLTYVFKGPANMGVGQPGSWSPDFSTLTVVVPPNADGTLGAAPFFLGSFPTGSTQVFLTVTDQTGLSTTTSVSVNLANFSLGTTQSTTATVAAGQQTNFTFSPTVSSGGITIPASFTGIMALSCAGTKDSNGSTLAANGMTCTMSPTTISQGQSSSVLITTTGPNFSYNRPVKPGSRNNGGMMGALLAMLTFPAFGIVWLPGERRKKAMLLMVLLVVVLVMFQTACGGGATQPVTQTVAPSTPTGTYTIVVTGTAQGGVVSTSTFKVTVQ